MRQEEKNLEKMIMSETSLAWWKKSSGFSWRGEMRKDEDEPVSSIELVANFSHVEVSQSTVYHLLLWREGG